MHSFAGEWSGKNDEHVFAVFEELDIWSLMFTARFFTGRVNWLHKLRRLTQNAKSGTFIRPVNSKGKSFQIKKSWRGLTFACALAQNSAVANSRRPPGMLTLASELPEAAKTVTRADETPETPPHESWTWKITKTRCQNWMFPCYGKQAKDMLHIDTFAVRFPLRAVSSIHISCMYAIIQVQLI